MADDRSLTVGTASLMEWLDACPTPFHVAARAADVLGDAWFTRFDSNASFPSRGYQVIEAASGEQGVAMVRKGPHPHLIFLDVRMGGMGGIEALQHIRSANPRQLVVLMTAFGTAQTAIEAMKYGAFDYVMKPFDPAKVLSLAQNALQAHADLRAVGDYKPSVNPDDYREGIVGKIGRAHV